MLLYRGELPRGIGRLCRGGNTLQSGFGPTPYQHEGLREYAFDISFPSVPLKLNNDRTHIALGGFCLNSLRLKRNGFRKIFPLIEIINSIKCGIFFYRFSHISLYLYDFKWFYFLEKWRVFCVKQRFRRKARHVGRGSIQFLKAGHAENAIDKSDYECQGRSCLPCYRTSSLGNVNILPGNSLYGY
jgi:hypothetical protein